MENNEKQVNINENNTSFSSSVGIEAISRSQYLLKHNIYFYLGSKIHIIYTIVCFLIFDSFSSFLSAYLMGNLILYRYVFNVTKYNNPFKIFLYSYLEKLFKKIRQKIRRHQ